MAEKPRVLVIERDASRGKAILESLGDVFEITAVRSISKALSMLRDARFEGVYVDSSQLAAVRWVGMVIQAEEILDAIADGVAVVDPDLRIIWANPEFLSLTSSDGQVVGNRFFQTLGESEILGPEPCPFTTAVASREPASTLVKIRQQPLLPGDGHAGVRRPEHADPLDRADPRDHRRDPPAAQGQRDRTRRATSWPI